MVCWLLLCRCRRRSTTFQNKQTTETGGFLFQILRWFMCYCFAALKARWNNQPTNANLVDRCETWCPASDMVRILKNSHRYFHGFECQHPYLVSRLADSPANHLRSVVVVSSSRTYWDLEVSRIGSSRCVVYMIHRFGLHNHEKGFNIAVQPLKTVANIQFPVSKSIALAPLSECFCVCTTLWTRLLKFV